MQSVVLSIVLLLATFAAGVQAATPRRLLDGDHVASPASQHAGRQLRQSTAAAAAAAAGCEPGFFLPTTGCQQCSNGLLANSLGVCPATNQRTATASAQIPAPNQRPFLHGLFSNRAVLARNRRGNVFGYTSPGTVVTVSLRQQKSGALVVQATATADSNGRWLASLGSLSQASPSSGPYKLTASRAGYSLTRTDILVGEVWLVGGQSNMVFALGDVLTGSATFKARAQSELNSAKDPNIRTFQVPRNYSATPLQNVAGSWNATTSTVIQRFSAVGYLTATKLRSMLGVPIGIVEADFGGTSIVDWVPPSATAALGGDAASQADPRQNFYNAMIAPLGLDFGGFDFTGTIWYQGESDGGLTAQNPLYDQYTPLLQSLLSSWRSTLGYPAMPFVIVQLANYEARYNGNNEPFIASLDHWPYVRESQRQVALTDGNAYLATAFDLGPPNNHVVHPPNKWDVASRAVRAMGPIYGFTSQTSGPTIAGIARGTSGKVTLSFGGLASGLRLAFKDNSTVYTTIAQSGTRATCFQLQNSQSIWRNATAVLQSDKRTISVGPIPGVSAPKGVRYGWLDGQPEGGCNLYNTAQLPAIPFTASVP